MKKRKSNTVQRRGKGVYFAMAMLFFLAQMCWCRCDLKFIDTNSNNQTIVAAQTNNSECCKDDSSTEDTSSKSSCESCLCIAQDALFASSSSFENSTPQLDVNIDCIASSQNIFCHTISRTNFKITNSSHSDPTHLQFKILRI